MKNEDSPTIVDHRKHDNPYFSRYGENWEEYIARSRQLRSQMKVTDMVSWYMKETEKAFIGTSNKDDWVIYHDALSLMTAASCKKWMGERGYLKRWILPSADLYDRHPDLTNMLAIQSAIHQKQTLGTSDSTRTSTQPKTTTSFSQKHFPKTTR